MIRVLLSAGDCSFETLLVYGKSITTLWSRVSAKCLLFFVNL